MNNLAFAVEDFTTYLLDAVPLWKIHQAEVGLSTLQAQRPFRPDLPKYLGYEAQGQLAVFTVRDEERRLVGYAVFIIATTMHYASTLCAINDALYLAPEVRKGRTGLCFMQWCEEALVERSNRKIKVVQWRTKAEHNFGAVLEHMGYSPDDQIFSKWVGD